MREDEPTEEELAAIIAEQSKPENLPPWWHKEVARQYKEMSRQYKVSRQYKELSRQRRKNSNLVEDETST